MPYADPNDPKKSITDHRYNNSQKGFIVVKMGQIFKPSSSKLRKGRNTVWKPELTKEDLKLKLSNHVLKMTQKYPETDGYICHFIFPFLSYFLLIVLTILLILLLLFYQISLANS